MKIIIRDGCTAFCTLIDGKNVNELNEEEIDSLLDKLFSTIRERVKQNNIGINRVIECIPYDDFESDNHVCDQCGDTVQTTTWTIYESNL